MASTLDHIEQTLGEAYRKEIDQEENVWRALPFFAATLAFQLVALSQLVLRLPDKGTGPWWDAIAAILLDSTLMSVAVSCLTISVAPAEFSYIADEPALLDYARGLDQDANETAEMDALAVLKGTLAEQYAIATRHNRQINQRRALHRSVAGLATLASVLVTVFLVARLMLYYLPSRA